MVNFRKPNGWNWDGLIHPHGQPRQVAEAPVANAAILGQMEECGVRRPRPFDTIITLLGLFQTASIAAPLACIFGPPSTAGFLEVS